MNAIYPAVLIGLVLSACVGAPAGQATHDTPVPAPELPAQAIRQLLSQSVDIAVNRLGRTDGYWANPQVRIPLPVALRRIEKTLRRYGQERYTDELAESLNHAAEAALPAARPVLLAAIRELSVNDAREIIGGSEDAAIHYFRTHSIATLRDRLRPFVAEATESAQVTAAYKRLLKKAVFHEKLADPARLDLDAYVTNAALDGLFLMMAEEERRIRRNPLARTTDLLKSVFR